MNIKLKQKIVEALEDGVGDPDNPPRAPTGIVPSFFRPTTNQDLRSPRPINPPKPPPPTSVGNEPAPTTLGNEEPGGILYGSPKWDRLSDERKQRDRQRFGD